MSKLYLTGRQKPVFISYLRLLLLVSIFTTLTTQLSFSQTTYTFSFKQAALNTVISEIATKTNYQFVYDASFNQKAKPINAEIKSSNIDEILTQVFKDQDFTYRVNGKTIVIKSKAAGENTYVLRGIVNDNEGLPMPGVTITQKGTTNMVHTDQNGYFAIYVSDSNNTLAFSYLGYEQKEVKYSKGATGTSVVVSLAPSNSILQEVVVTGYQTISKERSTAAISVVDNKTLNENINTDLYSALEGRIAGLMSEKNANGVGSDKLILRGIGTFSTSAVNGVGVEPLLVIDGLPTEISLSDVNPYDIESVNVLRDAAAASIYGSRAANGIIVLTTKKGSGNLKVTLNSDFFVSTKPNLNLMNYASTSEAIDYEQAIYNKERARYTNTASMFNAYGDIANGTIKYYSPLYQLNRDKEEGKITTTQFDNTINQWRTNDYIEDYKNNVWQNEFRQRYNLSFSGGTNKQNTFLSFNFDDSKQRIKYNQDKNFTLYAKSNFQLKSWLNATIGFNGSYSTADVTDASYSDFTIQNRYEQIVDANGNLVISPYVNIKDGFTGSLAMNGVVAGKINSTTSLKPVSFNILNALQEGIEERNSLALRAFANLQAKIYDGLSFGTQFQYENRRNSRESFYDANSYKMRYASDALANYSSTTNLYTSGLPAGGRYYQYNNQSSSYTFRNQLNYDKSFNQNKHSVSAIAGFEMREIFSPRSIEQLRYGYDPVTLSSVILDNASLSQTGLPSYIYGGNRTLSTLGRTQTEVKHRYFSVYSNMSYTYLSRYNVTGSVRIDRADLFGVDPQYKNRPLWSVGLGWNASNEEFLSNVSWIDMLKLRATYGVNGNVDQTTTPYLTATRRNDNLFPTLQYTNITVLPNPKLRWEKVASSNIGLDFSLFKGKLRGNFDVYNKYSSDLLATTELDPTVGALNRVLNSGEMRNRGIEIGLGSNWYNKNDLRFSSNFIIAFNNNAVKKVNITNSTAQNYVAAPQNYFFEDETFGSLYAYKYGGMINGYPYVLDENGNPSISFDSNGNPIATSIKSSINNSAALVNMGPLTPTYTGSLSQRMSYKQFDLNVLMVFSGGNKLRKDFIDPGETKTTTITNTVVTNGQENNLPRLVVDYPENLLNYAGNIISMWRNSDVNVVDADYVKLRNVSLSYNLPQSFANKIKISSAKITFQMNNIWYWSAAGNNIDPETYTSNSATRNIPLPKTYLFGFNLTL
ncbi:SusC/RagA family TonB-linked outer membrane protein [Pedobacter xixiisoli]|uniref:TonB-linked outer membrane protein, SusC/RagA family n=1 Tax=Pedobacter xixiisoli TaxID=1476464 RepID=A0A285ZXV6_9SPHI|nr:SusC/RagA family TonB-linked outer membrane protein [Pedobacter xixiisoli]SOD14493.1 TonB-linked outer membrane protein, SusC/RagA family [Pedobacter xixiisoli]